MSSGESRGNQSAKMTRVAVFPARGGSKRIPRKNVKLFMGKPIIHWSISAALTSGLFDKVLVSTDDAEIAQVAQEAGAEAPFVRPAELANDHATTTAVMSHALLWLQANEVQVDYACCIYPTAPLLDAGDLVSSFDQLEQARCAYVFSVSEFSAPIQRSFEIDTHGKVNMFFPDQFPVRSQDLPKAYHDAAQFYWGTADAWINEQQIFAPHSRAYPLPGWRVQDIDTPEDWKKAEILARGLLDSGF